MFCAILKATNSSFQKGMTFCRSVYVKKVMKLLAFIFEQPSYCKYFLTHHLGAQKNLLIETILFEYPQQMFWLRNKKISFSIMHS